MTDYEKAALDKLASRIARKAKREAKEQIEQAVDNFCRDLPEDYPVIVGHEKVRELIDEDTVVMQKISRIVGNLLDGC